MPPPRTARGSDEPSLFDLLLPRPSPEPEAVPPPPAPAPAAAESSAPWPDAAPLAPPAPPPSRTPRPPARPQPEGCGRSYFGPDHDPGVPSYGRVDRLDGRRSLLAAREPRHIRGTEARCVFADTLSGRDVPARWSDAAGVWIETA